MFEQFDFWKLLAGLGLFLFAMFEIEAALQGMAGRAFRQYLRDYTGHPLKAAATGILATVILRSSSMVGLMVMAFVGAGLMSLRNALGVILGSNLGTTFTGWLVTVIGFKLDLEALALPLIGVGGLWVVSRKGTRSAHTGRMIIGLGFLLLGLEFMKASVATLPQQLAIEQLAPLGALGFLGFGFLVAAVLQSSSATMMLTLAALHGGLINLPDAAAVAIGADLGTTSTLLIGSIRGLAPKKRVALGHFLFNLSVDSVAFLALAPMLALVQAVGISDPLYALVAFHSLFNFLGILVFLPFTGPCARFLERFFQVPEGELALHLAQATPEIPEAALAAVDAEARHLIYRVVQQNLRAFSPPIPPPLGIPPVAPPEQLAPMDSHDFDRMYGDSKKIEGEILEFAARLQARPMDPEHSARLAQLLTAARNAVHASKFMKDIRADLQQMQDASHPALAHYHQHFRSLAITFYGACYQLRGSSSATVDFAALVDALQTARRLHDQLHQQIYSDIRQQTIDETAISSLLNANREMFGANRSLLLAVGDFYLNLDQSRDLRGLPEHA